MRNATFTYICSYSDGMPQVADEQRLKVVQSEHLSTDAAQWLSQRYRLVTVQHDAPDFQRELADAVGLIVRTYTRVDAALLDAAPSLRVVARAGAGLDNIDVPACRSRGVEVVYTPDANTQAVVEYVMGLLSDTLRPRAVLGEAVDAQQWSKLREQTVAQHELGDLTLGILGLGRVGRRLAKAATGLGMKVLYSDLQEFFPNERGGASPVSVQALCEYSDILSVHVDGRASNRHLVSERFFNRMQPHAIFINTSRGFVVDTSALVHFLNANPGALALLDVHDPEPFGPDYPLLDLPNARLYPHLASRTKQAMDNMSWVVRDVAAVLEGKRPTYPAPERV